MPRVKRQQQAVVPTNALVASAHRYQGNVPRVYAPSKEWQKRTYHHYSLCGEARFAARYFGHAMSRADLYMEETKGQNKGKAVTGGQAVRVLADLFAGTEGQEEMLEMVGVHLTVGGECYLVGRRVDGSDIWEVLSALEVEAQGIRWQIRSADDSSWIPLTKSDVVIRVWLPKPGSRWEADSPFRSMLPVLDEIEWLSRYIHSQATSRLAGNGVLFLPDGVSFPPPPPVDGKEQTVANEAEGFTLVLGENMMQALKGDGTPAEQVPIVATVPGEYIDQIKHITFWTELDEHAREMRRDAIQRFALGMDLPPEMVLGMSSNEGTGGGRSTGVSHWGAWMLEEQTIKLHIQPMLDVLCAALTTFYIRPQVETTQIVRADTTKLKLRPDRSQEATELYDRGELSGKVMREENGFSDDARPDDDERKFWLLKKVASGSASPEQVGAALKALGVLDMESTDARPGNEAPAPPSLEDHPTRPRTPAENNSLLPAYEALVLRALERAGNRLRNQAQSKPPCPAHETHTLVATNGNASKCLEDAWSTAPEVLDGVASVEKVVEVLDSYCAALLSSQRPHTREALREWCEKAGI